MTKRASLLVALGGILFVLGLYFLPDRTPPKLTLYDDLTQVEIDSMSTADQAALQRLLDAADSDNPEKRLDALMNLSLFWNARNKPALQAESLRKAAEIDAGNNERWAKPGDLFFESIHSTEDESEQMNYVFHAMYCLEKHLEANPDDHERKLKLSECYTDHQGNIMQGVLLLREVAEADPQNTEAQMRLGQFSMMSGQTDKAINRFRSALAGDSLNLQARILLSEAMAGSGDLNSALGNLQEGLTLFSDTLVLNELQSMIKQVEIAIQRSTP